MAEIEISVFRLAHSLRLSTSAAVSRQRRPSKPRGGAALLRQQPEARRRVLGSRTSHAVSLGRRSSPSMHPGPAL